MKTRTRLAVLALLFGALPRLCVATDTGDGDLDLDSPGLSPADLGVIINTDDRLSEAIGKYYISQRKIPPANVVRVRFDSAHDGLSIGDFAAVRQEVERRLPASIQAYALTWARPYRVGCMSMTSAFAFGFDPRYCASGCAFTKLNLYFNAPSARPYDDLHMRPAMAIAATDFVTAKRLIDRGVQSDSTFPRGTAYLLTTADKDRSPRTSQYPLAAEEAKDKVHIEIANGPGVKGRPDVLFYFIGAITVPDLGTNQFLPGAIADHLTSFGGKLTDSRQMSSLRWIEAGATGSYGTVVEPCAFPAKFPDVSVVVRRYLAGETLVEAYWKSVAMPGQGLFIGEPLAAPFRTRSHTANTASADNPQ